MNCSHCGKDCGPKPMLISRTYCSSECKERSRDCDRCYGTQEEVGPTSPIDSQYYLDVCDSCREELT